MYHLSLTSKALVYFYVKIVLVSRAQNCNSLVVNATKNWELATKFLELATSWRLTICLITKNNHNTTFVFKSLDREITQVWKLTESIHLSVPTKIMSESTKKSLKLNVLWHVKTLILIHVPGAILFQRPLLKLESQVHYNTMCFPFSARTMAANAVSCVRA